MRKLTQIIIYGIAILCLTGCFENEETVYVSPIVNTNCSGKYHGVGGDIDGNPENNLKFVKKNNFSSRIKKLDTLVVHGSNYSEDGVSKLYTTLKEEEMAPIIENKKNMVFHRGGNAIPFKTMEFHYGLPVSKLEKLNESLSKCDYEF
jgi:hypothetical protein